MPAEELYRRHHTPPPGGVVKWIYSQCAHPSFLHLQTALAREYKMAAFELGYENPSYVSAN
jgi:hypothetical protein